MNLNGFTEFEKSVIATETCAMIQTPNGRVKLEWDKIPTDLLRAMAIHGMRERLQSARRAWGDEYAAATVAAWVDGHWTPAGQP